MKFQIVDKVESKAAVQLAKMWKSADATKRAAACQVAGDCFAIAIEHSKSLFVFYADVTVKTLNAIFRKGEWVYA